MAQRSDRSYRLHPFDKPVCPSCDNPVRRGEQHTGWSAETCMNSVVTSENPKRTEACGQRVLIASVAGGACLVVPLTKAEKRKLREHRKGGRQFGLNQVLEELGVLGKRAAS